MISSDEKKILTLIKILPLFIIVFSIFITYIIISNNNLKFEQEIINIKTDSINKTKEVIQNEVERVFNYIKNEDEVTIITLKQQLKNRVNEAWSLANNIYLGETAKGNKSKEEIFSIIKNALGSIIYNNGRGYFFMLDKNGVLFLQPLNKKMENKNILHLKDLNGYEFVKTITQSIIDKTERFDSYFWYKNATDKTAYEKISFYKYFAPLDITIGTGEYKKDFEKELQDRLLKQIQKIRYGKNGYIFIFNKEGLVISHINKKLIGEKTVKTSLPIIKQLLKIAKKGSGFHEYIFAEPNTDKSSTKISFVKLFKKWGWTIGTGVYTNDIDEIILTKRTELEKENKEQIISISFISFIITIVLFIFSIVFSNTVKNKFITYRKKVKQNNDDLKQLNKTLENKVEKRTKSLNKQTNKLTDLLNNAAQGFLSFDKDFLIDEEYSLECEHLLGVDLKEKDIAELLFSDQLYKMSFFKETIMDVLKEQNELTSSLLLSLLPSEMIINKRAILIEYKILSDNKIMMILTNITDNKKLISKIKIEQNILKMIVSIVSDNSYFYETKKSFEEFCNDYLLFINQDHTLQDNVNTINALIHTFKGLFAQLYMKNTVKHLHYLETELFRFIDTKRTNEDLAYLIESYELKKYMNEDLQIITHSLGESFLKENNKIKVDEKILNELEDKIISIKLLNDEHQEEWEKILNDVQKIKIKSLHHYLSVYSRVSQQLAISLDKSIHPFEISGDKNTLMPDNFKAFVNSLIHVFRNCCDHGIETKEKRIELNKNETANINCEFTISDNNLSITISDDGQGINIDTIKEKILNKKLCDKEKLDSFSTTEIIDFIFNPNFTTHDDNLTEISGRGIGLSAVKYELIKLKGTVEIKTEINKGTIFIFKIPLSA